MLNFKTLTTGLALAATLGVAAEARDLRLAPAAPPAHPANGVMYTNFAKYLPEESDGRLTGTIIGPEVVSLGQMKDALQSQIAEVGNLLPLYFPADFPNMALTGELSLMGTNSQATAAAVTEYMVFCEECQKEMRDFGIVFLGSGASDLYEILSTKPVKTAEDLQGLRLRSGGAPWGRFAEHFGAVPAQMSVFDQFEAVSQGVIDGTMASIADLISFRMVEVIDYVTYVPMGMYQSTSNFATSTMTWDDLSPEDRAAMVRAANRANTDFTHRWAATMPAEAEEAAKEAGIEFVEPDPSLVEAIQEFIATEPVTAADLASSNFGIEDGEERIAQFLELVDKWTAVAEEVDNDPVAMAERIQAEVWDKVDYATYGTAM
ncbi:MAG: C4-dicarboxylate ABC transporter substrate-binding protein [Maritimibacter sp.]|nr:C4-dicarboxylate ABC transporter substrate-binding protein [Maritimibacter sp.]MAS53020.1 C4-dicarboxylate ABC transporter substrate-binding protein [Pimelobacter sp.]